MQTSLYVDLSGQIALEDRISTLARNIANGQTPGFLAEKIQFSKVLAQMSHEETSFVSAGKKYLSLERGPITYTGNPLDIAVKGDAWLAIQSPQTNEVSYTRDGRMQISVTGELQTLEGYSVLDAGGAPIVVDTQLGPITIASDGVLLQNKQPVGAFGLFKIPSEADLRRGGNSSVIPSFPPEPVTDFTRQGVSQGYLEGSNVNPVVQITHLIEVQRFFEALSAAHTKKSASLEQAVQTIGKAFR